MSSKSVYIYEFVHKYMSAMSAQMQFLGAHTLEFTEFEAPPAIMQHELLDKMIYYILVIQWASWL